MLRLLVWVAARVHAAGRVLKYAFVIRRSGLSDASYYRRQCAGDAFARRAPILHYLVRGARAGLDPSRFFDTSYYLEQFPDVAARGKNPFIHFIRHGARERRAPSPRLEAADHLAAVHLNRAMRTGMERAPMLVDPRRARRVLVVDQRIPTPDRDSASVRMFAIVKLLRRLGHEITFVSDADRARARDLRALRRLRVDLLMGFDVAWKHLASNGHEYAFAILSSPKAADRYLMLLRAYAPRAKVVYDTVDLHWVRLERGAAVTGDPVAAAEAARYRALERVNATCADLTLTVTDADREALLREVPEARVDVVPNIHHCARFPPSSRARAGLMFIGEFSHAPNPDAVEWFAEEILPLVHQRLPGTVLRVVGGGLTRRVRRLASAHVRIMGHVRNVVPLFNASRVFVSPLRYGAGMKGKIGQSMSLGLPVVTTGMGAEGMMLAQGENALVADDPAAFADAIVRLASDDALWAHLSRNGLDHVAKHFSEGAALARLASLFGDANAEAAAGAEMVPVLARIRP